MYIFSHFTAVLFAFYLWRFGSVVFLTFSSQIWGAEMAQLSAISPYCVDLLTPCGVPQPYKISPAALFAAGDICVN